MPIASPAPWKMFLPFAAVLALVALWSAFWFVASGIAEDRFSTERTRLAAQGTELSCTRESWGGFPFHFEFRCESPILVHRREIELRSGSLLVMAQAYRPWQVVALLDGPSTITAPRLMPKKAEHQRAVAAVTLDRDGEISFSAELPMPSVEGLGRASKIMVHGRPSAGNATELALQMADPVYQPPAMPPLSASRAEVIGTLLEDRSFRVDRTEIEAGSIRFWGSGKLSLDDKRRPAGLIDMETDDPAALLALLRPYLSMTEQQVSGLKSVLGLLGNEAKLPLVAKDGVLYAGPFKVADIPSLD